MFTLKRIIEDKSRKQINMNKKNIYHNTQYSQPQHFSSPPQQIQKKTSEIQMNDSTQQSLPEQSLPEQNEPQEEIEKITIQVNENSIEIINTDITKINEELKEEVENIFENPLINSNTNTIFFMKMKFKIYLSRFIPDIMNRRKNYHNIKPTEKKNPDIFL